jgi:hypothetical protein
MATTSRVSLPLNPGYAVAGYAVTVDAIKARWYP